MPYKNREVQRSYQREWQRGRRLGAPSPGFKVIRQGSPEEIRTAADLLELLGGQIDAVLQAKSDIFLKARTVAYLAGICLRAVELSDLEARLSRLEDKLLGGSR